jgi:hypothetical protein
VNDVESFAVRVFFHLGSSDTFVPLVGHSADFIPLSGMLLTAKTRGLRGETASGKFDGFEGSAFHPLPDTNNPTRDRDEVQRSNDCKNSVRRYLLASFTIEIARSHPLIRGLGER